MSCVSAYSVNLSPKPLKPSQLHYFTTKIRAPTSLNLTQPTKFRISVVRDCSDKLTYDVRKRAVDAIDSGGRRATIGDVVTKGGLNLNEAQKALQALAADTNGFLEVSNEGDVVYVFPDDYRLKLAVKPVKSFRIMIEPFMEKGKMAAAFLVKVSFGMSLAAASVVALTGILVPAILSCDNPDEENDAIDFIGEALSILCGGRFIEYVFSIVFGDGDPNQGIEEKRWKMIGQYIALNGGVVTAEELAPYFDLKTTKKMEDDSYMLPVLLRFGGQPEVDEEGYILYHFPSLVQSTAPLQRSRGKECIERWADWVGVEKFLKENEWKFSNLDDEKIRYVNSILGRFLCWVITFGIAMRMIKVSTPFLSYIFLPLLLMYVIYAGSFFVIEAFRWFLIEIRNVKIGKRNEAREQRSKALESPDHSLKHKLLSARSMAWRKSIDKDRIVYSTEKDLYESDYERREWDRRFKERWN